MIGSQAAGWLWPDSRLIGSAWTRGVPVNLEVTGAGLVLSTRTRLLRGKRWAPVTLAWDELGGASARSLGHVGRTGGLTLHETFEVTLDLVGPHADGFRMPAEVSSLLPGFPADVDVVGADRFAPFVVTMPHGDVLAAEVTSRAAGRRRSYG